MLFIVKIHGDDRSSSKKVVEENIMFWGFVFVMGRLVVFREKLLFLVE